MSSEMFIYSVPKDAAEKDSELAGGLLGKPVDEMTLQFGEESLGVEIFWISPRSGNIMEGLQQHIKRVWDDNCAYYVTAEELKNMLSVSRMVADRDKEEFHDPEGFHAYLMKEFKELEERIDQLDFDKFVLYAKES